MCRYARRNFRRFEGVIGNALNGLQMTCEESTTWRLRSHPSRRNPSRAERFKPRSNATTLLTRHIQWSGLRPRAALQSLWIAAFAGMTSSTEVLQILSDRICERCPTKQAFPRQPSAPSKLASGESAAKDGRSWTSTETQNPFRCALAERSGTGSSAKASGVGR